MSTEFQGLQAQSWDEEEEPEKEKEDTGGMSGKKTQKNSSWKPKTNNKKL